MRKKTAFGRWLANRGIGLEAFAAKTGFKYSTVSKWLYLKRRPRNIYRQRIAQVYPDCPLTRI